LLRPRGGCGLRGCLVQGTSTILISEECTHSRIPIGGKFRQHREPSLLAVQVLEKREDASLLSVIIA
jgi:hypothetical protein